MCSALKTSDLEEYYETQRKALIDAGECEHDVQLILRYVLTYAIRDIDAWFANNGPSEPWRDEQYAPWNKWRVNECFDVEIVSAKHQIIRVHAFRPGSYNGITPTQYATFTFNVYLYALLDEGLRERAEHDNTYHSLICNNIHIIDERIYKYFSEHEKDYERHTERWVMNVVFVDVYSTQWKKNNPCQYVLRIDLDSGRIVLTNYNISKYVEKINEWLLANKSKTYKDTKICNKIKAFWDLHRWTSEHKHHGECKVNDVLVYYQDNNGDMCFENILITTIAENLFNNTVEYILARPEDIEEDYHFF